MADLVALQGSERALPTGAALHEEPVDADAPVEVTVYLRRDPGAAPPFDPAAEARTPPAERRHLSGAEATVHYGAAEAELQTLITYAAGFGLAAGRVNRAARSVRLSGTAAQVAQAFGVDLRHAELDGNRFRTHAGPVQLPAPIAEIVEAVFGLDDRPLGRSFLRLAKPALQTAIAAWQSGGRKAEQQPAGSFLPPQVATLYGFPEQDASGRTVAVFAFNDANTPGGYDPKVLDAYFKNDLGLPAPSVSDVTVLGPGNSPGDGTNPNDASPEVYLDLSIVGALAPGAKIVVYFSEFTEQGWVDVLSEASTDVTNDPDVISISYGNPEDGAGTAWSQAAVTQVNKAFEAAAARGKTITAASGDNGASDGEQSGVHVDFPASSPWVLAAGGTRLAGSGTTISSETVWNDQAAGNGATGGGVSAVMALPDWQQKAKVPNRVGTTKTGRGVPDVASLADPETPFIVAQPQGTGGVGGTSAAAPLWAALIARLGAALGKPIGYLNPTLYGLASNPLRDITEGDNKTPGGEGYSAGAGWDACTGWGSPNGTALLKALGGK